jgi:hypothetical protein
LRLLDGGPISGVKKPELQAGSLWFHPVNPKVFWSRGRQEFGILTAPRPQASPRTGVFPEIWSDALLALGPREESKSPHPLRTCATRSLAFCSGVKIEGRVAKDRPAEHAGNLLNVTNLVANFI